MANAFTQDHIDTLKKTADARMRLLDGLDISEVKGDAVKMATAVKLLDSIDNSVISVAKVRVEETSAKTSAEIQASMAEFVKTVHAAQNSKRPSARSGIHQTVPETIKPKNIEGLMDIGPGKLSMADFTK